MAFESLQGIKAYSHGSEQTFVVGDFFAVYSKNEEIPTIYNWAEVKSIIENRTDFIINVGGASYDIPKSCIPDERKLLNLRGVLEGAVSTNPSIEYHHQKRILPPKYLYMNGDVSGAPYIVSGVYKEREINFSNVILINTRIGKFLKIFAVLVIITAFLLLHFYYGNTDENWFYFLPVSIFAGGIATMIIYLICAVIANFHYSSLDKIDPALSKEITFTISEEGFSAVESHLYTGGEFIPWNEANYFIETNSVFIVYKNNKAVFWLPKRLFKKEAQKEISKFIHERLVQK
ncbi:MAG: YcxB family protein [Oscillospiraceae bacterium]|nr:YcxB family protein [Oscillospiraceae bacterium]